MDPFYTPPNTISEEYKPLPHKKKPTLASKPNHSIGVEMVFSSTNSADADCTHAEAESSGSHNKGLASDLSSKCADWQLIRMFSFLLSNSMVLIFLATSSFSDTSHLHQINAANAGHNQNIKIPNDKVGKNDTSVSGKDFSHSPPLLILSKGCSGSSIALKTKSA
eukprot:9803888-Ditylum_brightwellii.AAC.1